MTYETLDYKISRLTPNHRLNLPLRKSGMGKKYPIPCVSSDSVYLIDVGTSIARYDPDNLKSPITMNSLLAPIVGVNHTSHGVFVDDGGSGFLLDRDTLEVNRELPNGVSFSKNSAVHENLFFVYRKKGEGILAPVVMAAINCETWEFAWEFESKGSSVGFCVESGKLVLADYDGSLYCLDSVTGVVIWQKTVESLGVLNTEELKTRGGSSLTDTPRVFGSTVTLAYIYNYLIGLDLDTGELKWKVKLDGEPPYTTVTEAGILHLYSPKTRTNMAEMCAIACETGEIFKKLEVIVPKTIEKRFNSVAYTDVTNTHLWCLSTGGLLSAVSLVSGEVDWHYDIGESLTHNPFFITGNKLFVATRSELSVFEGS